MKKDKGQKPRKPVEVRKGGLTVVGQKDTNKEDKGNADKP